MSSFMSRYYKRKIWNLEGKILTPLFLGGADQGAEWRGAPFKALLRYWWRLTHKPGGSWEELLKEEGRIFGSVGEQEGQGGQSLVRVMVSSAATPEKGRLKTNLPIPHPEVAQQQVEALLYLGGMGLLTPRGELKESRSYFPKGSQFFLLIESVQEVEGDVKNTLALIQAFGALGSRCRNGWGSFCITSGGLEKEGALRLLDRFTHPWQDGFSRDYPTCLGKDDRGPLLWKTKSPQKSWEEAMRDLADAYASVRAVTAANIGPLDADGTTEPAERHLLGFPLTNHQATNQSRQGWGPDGRHASPLRFVIRPRPEGFIGFVLHLPHRFSDSMTEGIAALQEDKQLAVWRKVHTKLDHLLHRASYEECL